MQEVMGPEVMTDLVASGLPAVGQVRWGSHICQFYATRDDLAETLVPYFKAGLLGNEQCLWIASEPFATANALDGLRRTVPDLDDRVGRGQIEIVDHADWYLRSGKLGPDDVMRDWLQREARARAGGYQGLRISGNTFLLGSQDWDSFANYEASLDSALHGRRILALCSYSLTNCGGAEIVDVVRNHGFALVRRANRWEMIQSANNVLAVIEQEVKRTGNARAPAAGHVTRVFDSGAYPNENIAEYIRDGLARGGALVFATPRHLEEITATLGKLGVNVAEEVRSTQLVMRNAEEIAGAVVGRGEPSRPRFDELVTATMHRAVARYGRVRIYGEIVDVLARRGDPAAALVLEGWWNELLEGRPVELLCGYGMDSFADAGSGLIFRRICAEHAVVEPMPGRVEAEDGRLVAELQQTAAALETEAMHRREIERQRDRLRDAEQVARLTAATATEQLAHLQRITSALSEVTTLSEVAEVVASDLRGVLGADAATLAVSRDDGAPLQVFARPRGGFPTFPVDVPLALEEAFRAGTPLWLTANEHMLGCVPLVLAGQRLGALGLAFPLPYPGMAERALVEDYAKQLAVAVDRARSYDELQRARGRLQLLADAAHRIARAKLDLRQVLDAVVHELTRAGFAGWCAIHLRSEDGGSLPLAAFLQAEGADGGEVESALRAAPIEIGVGPVGQVADTGQPVLVTRPSEAFAGLPPPDSLIVAPLRSSGAIIGTLTAARHPGPAFTRDDQQLLQDLADRAALSVDNALLYERAQRERARAEQEWGRAESASRAKDEFLAMLGHELRNPLSPILTAVQLMAQRDGGLVEKERTIIERQVSRMVRLVDDLLDVSRIARGKIELKRAPIELGAVVADAIEIASPALEQRSHQLVVSVPASGLLVEADADRLTQVVVNLLTNAAKFTPPCGLVEVVATPGDGRVALSVRDTGVGIAPELLPRVFDQFVQGGQASDRAQGGLGLGLSIARRLVELHEGALRAESAGVGHGSRFTVELPLLEPSDHPAPAEPLSPSSTAGDVQLRILVVDDNVDGAVLLGDALATMGHIVRVAHDGPSALRAAADFNPELALLDIGLPVMDGYELAQRLAAASQALKLVAVTGYGLENDRQRSSAAGFHEHLVKPLDFERIRAVIRRLFPAPS